MTASQVSHRPSVFIHHFIGDEPMKSVAALAICQYTGEAKQVYLFYCDSQWEVIQDDLFDNLEEALQQASIQCEGLLPSDWQFRNMQRTVI